MGILIIVEAPQRKLERTPWTTRAECPHHGEPEGPVCRIEVDAPWDAALDGIEAIEREVFYWLHEARRDRAQRSENSCPRPPPLRFAIRCREPPPLPLDSLALAPPPPDCRTIDAQPRAKRSIKRKTEDHLPDFHQLYYILNPETSGRPRGSAKAVKPGAISPMAGAPPNRPGNPGLQFRAEFRRPRRRRAHASPALRSHSGSASGPCISSACWRSAFPFLSTISSCRRCCRFSSA